MYDKDQFITVVSSNLLQRIPGIGTLNIGQLLYHMILTSDLNLYTITPQCSFCC